MIDLEGYYLVPPDQVAYIETRRGGGDAQYGLFLGLSGGKELGVWYRTEEARKAAYGIVTVLVKAAEKQREAGTLTIPKYDYVVQMLEAKGIKVTAEVKAVIEAAVKELDIAVDSAIGKLDGIFVEETTGKTDGEKELNN